jgi:hypothetical protein
MVTLNEQVKAPCQNKTDGDAIQRGMTKYEGRGLAA